MHLLKQRPAICHMWCATQLCHHVSEFIVSCSQATWVWHALHFSISMNIFPLNSVTHGIHNLLGWVLPILSPLTSESPYDGAKLIVLLIWIRCESFWAKFLKGFPVVTFPWKLKQEWVMTHMRSLGVWLITYEIISYSHIHD